MKILKFENKFVQKSYLTLTLLGFSYKLNLKYSSLNSIELQKKNGEFDLIMPKKYKDSNNMEIINQAIQKLYSEVAKTEIEKTLELVRHITKFAPEDYILDRNSKEFYKIVRKNILVINPDIIQYNKEIINTTLIQAFCKMMHTPTSKIYKETLKNALRTYEEFKSANHIDYRLIKAV